MTKQNSLGAVTPAGRKLIYLADLTHTGQIVSANVHPLGIGLIAAYAKQELGERADIELF